MWHMLFLNFTSNENKKSIFFILLNAINIPKSYIKKSLSIVEGPPAFVLRAPEQIVFSIF